MEGNRWGWTKTPLKIVSWNPQDLPQGVEFFFCCSVEIMLTYAYNRASTKFPLAKPRIKALPHPTLLARTTIPGGLTTCVSYILK